MELKEKVLKKTSADLIEELYEDFIEQYQNGKFVEGICEWNGDDALMGPRSVAHTFKKKAEGLGYTFEEYSGFANELEEWVDIHLGNLESKFR